VVEISVNIGDARGIKISVKEGLKIGQKPPSPVNAFKK
jgi:hypothetical protein